MKMKFAEWKIEEELKTPEDRAFYLEAALEDAISNNNPAFFAVALADVAKSIGQGTIPAFMVGVSTGIASSIPVLQKNTKRKRQTARSKLQTI